MRRMIYRRGNAVIAGMVFLLALFSNAALAKTQIQFWDGQNWEIIKTLVAEFNAQSETVEVILGEVPGGGQFLERLTTAALGNALPDISRVEGGWVPQLAVNNLILPTSEYGLTPACICRGLPPCICSPRAARYGCDRPMSHPSLWRVREEEVAATEK